MGAKALDNAPKIIGQYELHGEIASGGMATIHLGRLRETAGASSQVVAIKRLHPQFAGDPEFVSMFLDEARLAARIRHPNVVSTIDVVATQREVFLVMEYVPGDTLSRLIRTVVKLGEPMPLRVAAGIVAGALEGLHAAHEATSETGEQLGLVHRDVSPQNVLVGVDGAARVLDFGVAKAIGRLHITLEGRLKGKLAYMSPEQLEAEGPVTRQADIFAASAVLWETLTSTRLFAADSEARTLNMILNANLEPPSMHMKAAGHSAAVLGEIDRVTMRGLERDLSKRYATAHEMADDLRRSIGVATPAEIGAWVKEAGADALAERSKALADIEGLVGTHGHPESSPAISLFPGKFAPHSPRSSPAIDVVVDPVPSSRAIAAPEASSPKARPEVIEGATRASFVKERASLPPGRRARTWGVIAGGAAVAALGLVITLSQTGTNGGGSAANAAGSSSPDPATTDASSASPAASSLGASSGAPTAASASAGSAEPTSPSALVPSSSGSSAGGHPGRLRRKPLLR